MTFLMKLLALIAFLLPLSSYAQFADLEVQCKREKAPSNRMILNAHQMFLATKNIIEKETAERVAQGRDFQVMIVARAGTNPKKNILLNDNPDGEEITLATMRSQAITAVNEELKKRHSDRRRAKAMVKQTIEDLYGEKADSNRNLAYSHVGILIKSDLDPNGWSFIHLLSPCNSQKSRIYHEGIGTFFMDDPYAYKAWFMIPTDDIQQKIVDVINSTTRPDGDTIHWSLMAPTYNLAAHLSNPEEANSNSWPVYVLASAISNQLSLDYRQANQLVKDLDFRPSKIILNGYHTLAMSPLAPKSVEIRKSEHQYSREFGAVEILTALSINEFMKRHNVLDKDFEYVLPPELTFKKK